MTAEALGASADDWLSEPVGRADRAPSPEGGYRAALARYEGVRLVEIRAALALPDLGFRPHTLPAAIAEHLGDPKVFERTLAAIGTGARLAATLFALTETPAWPLAGLAHALTCLGIDPVPAIRGLADHGLVALWLGPDGGPVYDVGGLLRGEASKRVELIAHPMVLSGARTVLPEGTAFAAAGPVGSIRETDGLEPVIRMAAVWQRVVEEPLRQTQQGTLYKRDRERLEDDPVLAGPIADALEPLPDMAALWVVLAREVGLLEPEPGGDRVMAARPDFWDEHALHLPRMIAVKWLALRTWHEQGGMQQEGSVAELAWPYVRPTVLLWLATLPEGDWVRVDDLADQIQTLCPEWEMPIFLDERVSEPPARPKSRRGKRPPRIDDGASDARPLDAMLLGAGYQLGLVRVAEESATKNRVVQLTPLGRYALALGPPPPAKASFEHFLFVQPNFEIIAYRQGLTPSQVGAFSRFAQWVQIGAATELRLTPGSVYRGLEGGLTPEVILDRLARHSPRPLPSSIAEALRTWAQRRERVTYHAAATLVEFATPDDREMALKSWPSNGRVAPVPVADRLLLVEDAASIPFQRFRLAGSRDYRRPPETCLEVEADGVTLSLDLARSDLLVDAELARFADELPKESPAGTLRKFRVTPGSLARGANHGLTLGHLDRWYQARTGAATPPAVRLMFLAASSRVPPLTAERPLVVHTPTPEILDGLLQHPLTGSYLGDRLGPTAVVVPDHLVASFQRALASLGLTTQDALGPNPQPKRDEA